MIEDRIAKGRKDRIGEKSIEPFMEHEQGRSPGCGYERSEESGNDPDGDRRNKAPKQGSSPILHFIAREKQDHEQCESEWDSEDEKKKHILA
jgi:hypothetical protein